MLARLHLDGIRRHRLIALLIAIATVITMIVAPRIGRADTTRTIVADQDSTVAEVFPDFNFGSWGAMAAGSSTQVAAYVRFPEMRSNPKKAVLRVKGPQSAVTIIANRTAPSWQEGSLTWRSAQNLTNTTGIATGVRGSDGWTSIDVTTLVASGGVTSFRLRAETRDLMWFSTRESGGAARLELTYPDAVTTTATQAPSTTVAPTTTLPPTTTVPPTTTTTAPPPPPATGTLDPTGKTIPLTNYAVPAGAIFMSPTGSDANSGTISSPVKTLNAAIPKVPAGGTLVLRGGEHRDWYNANNEVRAISKNITIQAYPGEQPWFTGTDIVRDGWSAAGNVWSRAWSTPQFCRGKYDTPVTTSAGTVSPFSQKLWVSSSEQYDTDCVWADNVRDPNFPVAGDPQLAFANNTELTQVGTLAQVTPGSKTFFYDWNAKRIFVSENPTTTTVELASRPGAMVLGGAYDFTVRGVGFKRYASAIRGNVGATVVYVGLGGASAPAAGKARFENVVFAENAGATLSFSGPKPGTFVKNSVFAYNHGGGLSGNGFSNDSSARGLRNDLVLEGNIFNANNQGNIDTMCTRSCGVSAVKLNHMVGYVARNNVFENTLARAPGMWCDMDCSDGVMVNNIARNNGGHGIFYEISNKGIIANNLVYHNGFSGIAVAAANTKVYNNTIINKVGSNVQAVWLWDDSRAAPDKGATWPYWDPRVDLGPNTNGTEFANNLIVGQQPAGARLMNFASGSNTAPNTVSNEYFTVLDSNIYYHLSGQVLYGWGSNYNSLKTPADLRTFSGQAWETNTIQVIGSGDPFVNRATLDFRLRTDSQAYTSPGRPLPADVAAATGLSGPVSRGATVR